MTIYILLILAAVGTGMAISVYAFGTGGKRKRIFQDIYFSVEDNEGVGVVYTKNGEYAAILRMENPVDKYSADIDGYYEYTRLFTPPLPKHSAKGMRCTSRTYSCANRSVMRAKASANTCPNPTSITSMAGNIRTARPI